MDIHDTLNTTATPAENTTLLEASGVPLPQTKEPPDLRRAALYYGPGVGWCALSIYWLWQVLPFWLAIPLGLPLGVVLYFVTAAITGGGLSTLFELSVGGSISLVLAAVLTVGVVPARNARKRTTCITNVKSTSFALLMYAQDNDDHFPLANRWQLAADMYIPQAQKELDPKKNCDVALPAGINRFRPCFLRSACRK